MTTACDVIFVKLAMVCKFLKSNERAYVGDFAGDGGGGCGGGGGEEGTPALALATLEVAVGGADRVLAGRELIAVHGDAHRAAGFTPFGACVGEDAVEAFGLGLAFHFLRARDDQR